MLMATSGLRFACCDIDGDGIEKEADAPNDGAAETDTDGTA